LRRAGLLLGLIALAPLAFAQAPKAESPPPSRDELLRLADEAESDLMRHVVKPRLPRTVDREGGGFHASYGRDWTPRPDEARFIVYQARSLWLPAELCLRRPALREEHLAYVRHGVAQLRDVFWDEQYGGFHDWLGADGSFDAATGAIKSAYGQSFAVYALATAARATGDKAVLDLAKRGFRFIEDHYRDDPRPGYLGAVRRDGSRLPYDPDDPKPALVAIGLPAAYKSMNPHIHLLEAYTELLRAWPDPVLRRRTEELLAFVRDRLFVEPGVLHQMLTPEGRPIPGPDSFGHDVETAFLMREAEEVLGGAPDPRTHRAARLLVDHALAFGLAENGQLYNEGFAFGVHDKSVQWWAQYEAVNAFLLMADLEGAKGPRYWNAFRKAWDWTRQTLLDPEWGGVYQGVDGEGNVIRTKSQNWFAGYHTGRALLQVSDRLRRLAETPGPAAK
jgi:mannobiose 2-epimerase